MNAVTETANMDDDPTAQMCNEWLTITKRIADSNAKPFLVFSISSWLLSNCMDRPGQPTRNRRKLLVKLFNYQRRTRSKLHGKTRKASHIAFASLFCGDTGKVSHILHNWRHSTLKRSVVN